MQNTTALGSRTEQQTCSGVKTGLHTALWVRLLSKLRGLHFHCVWREAQCSLRVLGPQASQACVNARPCREAARQRLDKLPRPHTSRGSVRLSWEQCHIPDRLHAQPRGLSLRYSSFFFAPGKSSHPSFLQPLLAGRDALARLTTLIYVIAPGSPQIQCSASATLKQNTALRFCDFNRSFRSR